MPLPPTCPDHGENACRCGLPADPSGGQLPPPIEMGRRPLVRPHTRLGRTGFDVAVPFPDGQTAMVDVLYDAAMDVYGVQLAGELFDQAPEAVTAGVQMAMLAVREHRAH